MSDETNQQELVQMQYLLPWPLNYMPPLYNHLLKSMCCSMAVYSTTLIDQLKRLLTGSLLTSMAACQTWWAFIHSGISFPSFAKICTEIRNLKIPATPHANGRIPPNFPSYQKWYNHLNSNCMKPHKLHLKHCNFIPQTDRSASKKTWTLQFHHWNHKGAWFQVA